MCVEYELNACIVFKLRTSCVSSKRWLPERVLFLATNWNLFAVSTKPPRPKYRPVPVPVTGYHRVARRTPARTWYGTCVVRPLSRAFLFCRAPVNRHFLQKKTCDGCTRVAHRSACTRRTPRSVSAKLFGAQLSWNTRQRGFGEDTSIETVMPFCTTLFLQVFGHRHSTLPANPKKETWKRAMQPCSLDMMHSGWRCARAPAKPWHGMAWHDPALPCLASPCVTSPQLTADTTTPRPITPPHPTPPHPTPPHPTSPHHTTPHHTAPRRAAPRHTTPHHTTPHHTTPHHTTPHHTTPHHTTPHHTTPHHTTP